MGIFPLLLGAAVSAGGRWPLLSVAAAGSLFLISVFPIGRVKAVSQAGRWMVEVPVLLLLLSTLVLRIRGSADILEHPLDPAGFFRIACLGLAAFLGLLACLSPRHPSLSGPPTASRPIRLYVAYLVIVLLGVLVSPAPFLTLFHAAELAIALIVLIAAGRAFGPTAYQRILHTLYWFQVTLIALVWIEVFLLPGKALTAVKSPIHWQIEGVYPSIDHNGVGTLGAIVFVWSLGRFLSGSRDDENGRRSASSLLLSLLGLITLVGAQYRTGYIALMASLVLLLVLQYPRVLLILLFATGVVFASTPANKAEPFLLRGETPEEASGLSSRVDWWKLAIPVWKESPIIGGGLLTATRLDVLAPIGRESTSTIHSTWVEALVGTGVLGVFMLGASFLVLLWRAFRRAVAGHVIPMLLLVVIGVRSLTGTTFEASGRSLLMFLTLAFILNDRTLRTRVGSGGERAVTTLDGRFSR